MHGDVDLLAHGQGVHQDPHPTGHSLEPSRHDPLTVSFASHDEWRHLQRLLAYVDDVLLGDLEARDVDLLAVDLEVAVYDELARVAAGAGVAGTVDHVVQAGFEQLPSASPGADCGTRSP